jgi:hypothetical protein
MVGPQWTRAPRARRKLRKCRVVILAKVLSKKEVRASVEAARTLQKPFVSVHNKIYTKL